MFESPRIKKRAYIVKAGVAQAAHLIPVTIILGAIGSLLSFYVSADENAVEVLDIPSITATRTTRDTRSGDVISSDWVQLSPEGLRARQSGNQTKFEYLQNFSEEKLWMMDWSRKILLESSPEEGEVVDSVGDDDTFEPFVAAVGESPQSSVLTAIPCMDLVAIKVGSAEWREQSVTVWRCEFAGGEHYSEVFYSEQWGLVIREERVDQTTIELNNIKSADFSVGHFTPPTYFRKTDFRELIIGSPEIGSYSE